jgi:hypothetical protein
MQDELLNEEIEIKDNYASIEMFCNCKIKEMPNCIGYSKGKTDICKYNENSDGYATLYCSSIICKVNRAVLFLKEQGVWRE